MGPESLVLQPKVTEVRWTVRTGSVDTTQPTVLLSPTHPHKQSAVQSGLFQLAWLQSLSCIRLAPFWRICPPVVLFTRRVDALKWCKRGLSLTHKTTQCKHLLSQRQLDIHRRTRETTAALHFRFTETPCLPSIKDTNPLTVAVSLSLSLPVICASLPVASVFVFFFSLFLSADSHWHTEN